VGGFKGTHTISVRVCHAHETLQFWKQFFESSANVSLSGYEEQALANSHMNDETVTTEDSQASNSHTTLETSESISTPTAQHITTDSIADLDISNMTLSPSKSSTPRPNSKQRAAQGMPASTPASALADYPSPYEALRQEVTSTRVDTTLDHSNTESFDETDAAPSTPGAQRTSLDPSEIIQTPQSSPFLPPPPSHARPSTARKQTDPLLHRILDKNYRIQATPLTKERRRSPVRATPATAQRRGNLFDSALSSSPEVAPPQLHTELVSPAKPRGPRTPGVSVLTPGRSKPRASLPRGASSNRKPDTLLQTPQAQPRASGAGAWDFDDSSDDDTDLQFGSPPKTMQFHVPQNRLLKTPAKEASRRIVDDILTTAGLSSHRNQATGEIEITEEDLDFDPADFADDPHTGEQGYQYDFDDDLDHAGRGYQADEGVGEDRSPTVVRPAKGLEDETF
jgi:DASH complex subunit ASK1